VLEATGRVRAVLERSRRRAFFERPRRDQHA